jgi:putative transposase
MEGICRETIQTILGVSSPFISKWKINYALQGIEGLRLKHQGSQGQLKPQEREEIIQWLTNQNHARFIRPRKLYSRAVSD